MNETVDKLEWGSFLLNDRSHVKRLDYVERYNSIPSVFKETVSTHSFWVIFNSCLIHRKLCESIKTDPEILELLIMRRAMVHDLGEALTSDMVLPFKYFNPELKNMIDKVENDMIEKFFPESIKTLINSKSNSEEENVYINAVVKAADWMSVFHYMNREINRGNQEMKSFVIRMKKDTLKMVYDTGSRGFWYSKSLANLYDSMYSLVEVVEPTREV